MTYQEILSYIFGLARFGAKPGLERITRLLDALGNPHHGLKAVHVVGTNGKGSTASFLAAILTAAGYRTALYTSPHLTCFNERMRVGGREIGDDDVVRIAGKVLAAAPEETTFFEITTSLALCWFAEQRVDLVVLEAGMGGKLDATNVVDGIMTVVTPIARDHSEYLGDSLEKIAAEKAGIIGPGQRVVVSRQDRTVQEVLRAHCTTKKVPMMVSGEDFQAGWQDDDLLWYDGPGLSLSGLRPGIGGRYQVENAATALAALGPLSQAGFPVDSVSAKRGIETASWPGRMELFPGTPAILLDGAHNPEGSRALAESIPYLGRDKVYLVAGFMGDKDVAGILEPLLPQVAKLFAVAPALERAVSSARAALIGRELGLEAIDCGSVGAGLEKARTEAPADGLIVVCGSLFTVGEARASLNGTDYTPVRG